MYTYIHVYIYIHLCHCLSCDFVVPSFNVHTSTMKQHTRKRWWKVCVCNGAKCAYAMVHVLGASAHWLTELYY